MLNFTLKKITHTRISVPSNTATLILAANDRRLYALIVNDSNTKFYIKRGSAPVDQTDGTLLAANGFAYEMSRDNLWQGDVYAIHSGGAARFLTIEEGW